MQFNRMRLTGFKSFVEPTELVIDDGLTGVVGPNGCGKSNLVEALRWAMGETSAKQMRGGEMDDVIFAGTSTRPPRSFAEVVVTLGNADRTAPPAYNDSPMLEISRRIDREAGVAESRITSLTECSLVESVRRSRDLRFATEMDDCVLLCSVLWSFWSDVCSFCSSRCVCCSSACTESVSECAAFSESSSRSSVTHSSKAVRSLRSADAKHSLHA